MPPNINEIDTYDETDDLDSEDTESQNNELEEITADSDLEYKDSVSDSTKVSKRRDIDDLLEERRLEKELRDSFDDLDDDFYDADLD